MLSRCHFVLEESQALFPWQELVQIVLFTVTTTKLVNIEGNTFYNRTHSLLVQIQELFFLFFLSHNTIK